jgi:glycerol-3-phosphate acyltransferase PlsY
MREMQTGIGLLVLIIAYIIGSIPFGLVIVKLTTGQDVREIQSGRTGGTNAMRAAGLWAGILTAVLDFLKASICVLLARWIVPGLVWIEVLAPVMAILGHNYSIFLVERDENGKIRLHGGAGGASSAGGAFALWPPIIFIILPSAGLILYFVGYASVATLSVPIIATVTYSILAWFGILPWQYIFYGILAGMILAWALRPNIQRLINGTERLIGYRAKRAQTKTTETPVDDVN